MTSFKLILLPFYFCMEMCYFLIPVTFILLLILTIIQFCRKDFQRFNRLFQILVATNILGHLNGRLDAITSNKLDFININFLEYYLLIFIFMFTLWGLNIIYKKNDTRYYLFFTIPIILYMFGYFLWVIHVGI